jgi:acyl-CoA synthetase (AMP-forming)/AMP-acid ligase II
VEILEGARTPGRLLLTGEDSVSVATLAVQAVNRGWQVAFPGGRPDLGRWDTGTYSLKIVVDHRQQSLEWGDLPAREGPWAMAMSTSGTTGTPRTYGFTLDQIAGVCGIYRDVYRLSPRAHIVTALPAAHNFAFVAGVCAAVGSGAKLAFARDHVGVVRWLHDHGRGDRVIVLASPVLLETQGLEEISGHDLLVDSGAAPVSRPYLLRLRACGIDIREGYGTTETLSLTHFDVDGTAESAGTVGLTVPGVACRIADDSTVRVRSPFAGTPLDNTFAPGGTAESGWVHTGDLGVLDSAGRLRLVGREGDRPVGGMWPRDVLDSLGDLLGARTASVCTRGDGIEIRLRGSSTDRERTRIENIVASVTGLPRSLISIVDSYAGLTYSLKLPRLSARPS